MRIEFVVNFPEYLPGNIRTHNILSLNIDMSVEDGGLFAVYPRVNITAPLSQPIPEDEYILVYDASDTLIMSAVGDNRQIKINYRAGIISYTYLDMSSYLASALGTGYFQNDKRKLGQLFDDGLISFGVMTQTPPDVGQAPLHMIHGYGLANSVPPNHGTGYLRYPMISFTGLMNELLMYVYRFVTSEAGIPREIKITSEYNSYYTHRILLYTGITPYRDDTFSTNPAPTWPGQAGSIFPDWVIKDPFDNLKKWFFAQVNLIPYVDSNEIKFKAFYYPAFVSNILSQNITDVEVINSYSHTVEPIFEFDRKYYGYAWNDGQNTPSWIDTGSVIEATHINIPYSPFYINEVPFPTQTGGPGGRNYLDFNPQAWTGRSAPYMVVIDWYYGNKWAYDSFYDPYLTTQQQKDSMMLMTTINTGLTGTDRYPIYEQCLNPVGATPQKIEIEVPGDTSIKPFDNIIVSTVYYMIIGVIASVRDGFLKIRAKTSRQSDIPIYDNIALPPWSDRSRNMEATHD